jgi:carbonic anhydrase
VEVSKEVLDWLKAGNSKFVERVKARSPSGAALAQAQSPRAIILGCADSRTAPEILFDTQLGQLFVVRVAGNVASTEAIASIEYAVMNLGAELLVVCAHESCGAVGAALAGGDAGKNLNHLLKHIAAAVDEVGKDDVDAVARRSAQLNTVRMLSESTILSQAVKAGKLTVATAFFHFSTGEVEFF